MIIWPEKLHFHDYAYEGNEDLSLLRLLSRRNHESEARGYEWYPPSESTSWPSSAPESLSRAMALRDLNLTKSGIYELDDHLLVEILELSLPNRSPIARLHILMTVSYQWFNIIDNAPRLWARLDGSELTKVASKAIFKSGKHPLVINYHNGTSMFLSRVLLQSSRWAAATIEVTDPVSLDELSHPAPRLRCLTLVSKHSEITIPDFLGGAPGNLVQLALDRIAIPWNSSALSGLHSLSLANIRDCAPSEREILEILSLCSELEYLSFSRVTMRSSAVAAAPMPHAYLSKLQTIFLADFTSAGTQTLLHCIDAPACRSFCVQWELGRNNLPPPAAHGFISAALCNIAPNAERVEIYCGQYSGLALMSYRLNEFGKEESTVAFNVGTLEGVTLFRELDFIDRLPPRVTKLPAKLFMAGDMHVQESLLLSLSKFQSMTSLAFEENFCVATILDFLSTPRPEGWSFPCLDTLIFDSPNVQCAKALLGMVKARYGRNSRQSRASALPAPLQSICVSNQRKKDFRYLDQIKEIVGANVLETNWADVGSDLTDSDEFWFDLEQNRGHPWCPPQNNIATCFGCKLIVLKVSYD